jgi:ACR3 family arsenite efflux pump ArsB
VVGQVLDVVVGLLPGWLGLAEAALDVSMWDIAQYVLLFLGIPVLAGYLSRKLGERSKGREWYETRFLPRICPIALPAVHHRDPVRPGRAGATR